MMLEATGHSYSAFVTLTYSEANRPFNLPYEHISGFLKRLRKRHPTAIVRFCCAGEYGEKTNREHWHLIIFSNQNLWGRFGIVDEPSWPFGVVHIGTFTMKSARYVAKYVLKSSGKKTVWQTSRKPAIGAHAMAHLASSLAAKKSRYELPTYLELGNKIYPLDRSMRHHFQTQYEKAGGKIKSTKLPTFLMSRTHLIIDALVRRRSELELAELDLITEKFIEKEKHGTKF